MIEDYKKIDLFGKLLMQRIVATPPFVYDFPVAEQACFLFVRQGAFAFHVNEEQVDITTNHALLLNCNHSGRQIKDTHVKGSCEVVIVTFHPEILKKIYDRELPAILQSPKNLVSNKANETINNDFLIGKYIEGLLFYFENPTLVNEDILILKLKEVILLLAQTQDAAAVQAILSQLFSPTVYSFQQIIDAHLFSQSSVEELARQTNLSVSSFKREFARLYNDSPANYIKTKRLEKAAALLLASDERITDIAFACGFNDLANFTKSFGEKYHTTPTNYRLNQIAK